MKVFLVATALALCAMVTWRPAAAQEEDDDDDGIQVETIREEDLADYHSPRVDLKRVHFAEHFDDENAFSKRWVHSEARKQGVDEDIAKYDGRWEIQSPVRKLLRNDRGLVLTTEAKHAAISAMLNRPFIFEDKPLIVQYEVTMQEGQNCGGAYIKLLSRGISKQQDLKQFHDQTPYTIMFGPDKCGNNKKLHFIFRHVNPKNGTIEEKHAKKPTQRLEEMFDDKRPHLYTLVVRPDNSYSVRVDGNEVSAGSLLADVAPPVNPPEEIDDETDVKPADWDEREKIADPTATKPDDWDESAPAQITDTSATKPAGWLDDEPTVVPDPEAKKPSDWDNEMDGEWEAPLIDNPACAAAPGCGPWTPALIPNPNYKGIWRAPLIPNPNYKGKWSPRRIPNPNYFRDDHPFKMTPIHAIGFELWSMSPALLFDNVLVTDDESVAEEWARQTFALKRDKLSKDADSLVAWVARVTADKPWLWAVYLLLVIALVALIAYCCCSSSKDTESPEDSDSKKTDAVSPDDPHSEGEAEGDSGAGEGEEEAAGDRPRGKAQLETEPHSTQQETAEGEVTGDGPRKRKPRKE